MLHPQSRRIAADNRAAHCLNSLRSWWAFAYREEVKPKIGGNAKEGENKLHLGVQAVVDHFSGSLEPERSTIEQPYNDQCAQQFCGAQTLYTPGHRCSNHSSSAKPTKRG